MTPICYVAFSKSSGGFTSRLFGRLIRWFTSGKVNHAFLLFWSRDFGCWMTLGANAGGLEPLTLVEFLKTRHLMNLYTAVGWDLYAAMVKHAGDLGRAYNVAGLVGEAWVETVKKITGKYGPNVLDDKKELFCSEWVAEVCATGIADAGRSFDLRVMFNQVDPETLRRACDERPHLFAVAALTDVLHNDHQENDDVSR